MRLFCYCALRYSYHTKYKRTMQPSPTHLPALPLNAPDTAGSTAVDIVAALRGATTITLGGFQEAKAQDLSSWAHPAIPFVKATTFERDVEKIAASRSRWEKLTRALFTAALVCVAFALGHVATAITTDWSSHALSRASAWKVTGITDVGVTLQMGEASIAIPVGARLPNGDLVLSVSPQRNTVFLESSTLIVRVPNGAQK